MGDRWPTLLDPPEFRGLIRTEPEDFRVEEIPAYLPCGDGDHLMIKIRKRNHTTDQVVRLLAAHLAIPEQQVGTAGLKDRHAVTEQWVSVPAGSAGNLSSFAREDVEILESSPHRNKLKTGHLKGNRFEIRIRGLALDQAAKVMERCGRLVLLGAPNFFGPQRFGRDNQNEQVGRELLQGTRKQRPGRTLRLMLNAVQSGLFNDVVARRMESGWFQQALEGDLMAKADTGGLFLCTDPRVDQLRLDAFEIHPTGPMFGGKMKKPQGQALALEEEILAQSGLEAGNFDRYRKLTRGARRSVRLALKDLEWKSAEDGLVLSFSLPAGGYATSVLRELVVMEEATDYSRDATR
jgi:tRNA pseudouridine13 synthase